MSKKKINEVYSAALEEWPMATKAIKDPYKKMGNAFEDYIVAIQEEAFFYGYQCGVRDQKAQNG